jgi:hypothetical protein
MRLPQSGRRRCTARSGNRPPSRSARTKGTQLDRAPLVEAPIDADKLTELRQLGSVRDSGLVASMVDLFTSQAPGSLDAIRAAARPEPVEV